MSAGADIGLAGAVETVVCAVPGVAKLYPGGSVVATMMRAGARTLGFGNAASPVVVTERDGRVHVTISIGVHAAAAAGDTVRAVGDAISLLCAARGIPQPEIDLTVVHIDETFSTTEGSPA